MTLSPEELLKLAQTDVLVRLTPEQLAPVLGDHPFIDVEGTFNVRDLGRVPRSQDVAHKMKPGLAFRSGTLGRLTDRGKATLAEDLGVRRVFDLRSALEHANEPDPQPAPHVTMVWEETTEETPHVDLSPFVAGQGEEGYSSMYMEMLDIYKPTIRGLLEHVRDRPEEPFLFHCTAGRDRTGVVAGLLLSLAGEPSDVIALDYMLTRIGSEPARDQLEAFARMGSGVVTGGPSTSTGEPMSIADMAKAAPPGFFNLLNIRTVCWEAFQDSLRKKYGPAGYEDYVRNVLGFSADDIATIKKNLTV